MPFVITDIDPQKSAKKELLDAFNAAQTLSVLNGMDKITMEEINKEIAAYRREKREKSTAC